MCTRKTVSIALVLMLAGVLFARDRERLDGDNNQHEQKMVFPLKEGFVLEGVEGAVKKSGETGKWTFVCDTDISDGRYVIKNGTPVEMLPCGTLEKITTIVSAPPPATTDQNTKMVESLDPAGASEKKPVTTTDVPDDFTANVKLWARVTRYDGKNFLFAYLFLPVSEIQETAAPPDQTEGTTTATKTDSILPPEIISVLKPKRTVDLSKMRSIIEVDSDVMLVDRTGFLGEDNGQKTFTIDGLGRNVEDFSFNLLPCETLHRTELDIAGTAVRKRYKIAAIVTRYKNEYYMLLQRAVRTYNHGNFAR